MDSDKDFTSFMEASEEAPPAQLTKEIHQMVRRDLAPSPAEVFYKLLRNHGIALFCTLTVCPQFGLGPLFTEGHGIMGIVMKYGHLACAAYCALVFFCITLVLSKLTCSAAELRVMSRHALLNGSGLAVLSVVFFAMIATVNPSVTVGLVDGLVWTMVGASVVSLGSWVYLAPPAMAKTQSS